MNVGCPLLFVAVFSLTTLPQTVSCSPIWFLASCAEIPGASVELADEALIGGQPSRPTMQLSERTTAIGTETYPFCMTLSFWGSILWISERNCSAGNRPPANDALG